MHQGAWKCAIKSSVAWTNSSLVAMSRSRSWLRQRALL
jgi:hypothetical protein